MKAKFHVRERFDPRDRTLPPKYYAELVDRYPISKDELIDQISDLSTVSIADTYGVLMALIHLIPKHLKYGRTVKIGDLGTFYLSITSDGEEKPEDVTFQSIKTARVRFRPGKGLNIRSEDVSFTKMNNNGNSES